MLRDELARKIATALDRLIESGRLPKAEYPKVEISDTKSPEHGDFACNFAMSAAKAAQMNPREVGELMAEGLRTDDDLEQVEVAGPGFINLTLSSRLTAVAVQNVLDQPEQFYKLSPSRPLKINVEFVSVNPNGPITIGSGRGAAYGSALCNVLVAAGHTVHREYYINDGVNSEQMRLFAVTIKHYCWNLLLGSAWEDLDKDVSTDPVLHLHNAFLETIGQGHGGQSDQWFESRLSEYLSDTTHDTDVGRNLEARLNFAGGTGSASKLRYQSAWHTQGFVPPETQVHYKADYALEVAHTLANRFRMKLLLQDPSVGSTLWYQTQSQDLMIERQTSDLATFGVEFDTWFREQSLHDSGKVEELIDRLVEKGVADDQPVRTIIEYGKKGEIKEIVKEDQPVDEDTGEGQESDDSRESGEAQSQETATLWLRSTKFGDPQDRVLRRKDGRLTYIASDVAYHQSKFDRPEGADKLITVLGPDHHGYIGRLQAVVAALLEQPSPAASDEFSDDDAKIWKDASEKQDCLNALEEAKTKLDVIIFQLVRFVKDGKPAPMRKRDGNIFALIDLINEIGKKVQPNGSEEEKQTAGRDVSRFFYLMRNHDTTFDFDLDLAAKQSEENPVFYAQYAHARICSVVEKAAEAGFRVKGQGSENLELLSHPKEKALILKLQDLGYEVERSSEDYTVSRLTTYAVELARTYHHFYEACRVIQEEEPELSKARLALCHATRHALKATFDLLGISAPDRM